MRNQLRGIIALLVFSAITCVACNKEKIPPPANARQSTASTQTKSGTSTSSSSSDQSSSSAAHTGGCSHGG